MPGSWTFDPDTVRALRLNKAEQALLSGRLDEALIEAEELLDDHPSDKRALHLAGEAAFSMGDVLTALAAFTRLSELHTPGPGTLYMLALTRFEAVDYGGALAAAEQCTVLDPKNAGAWAIQGIVLERMGRHEDAEKRTAQAHSLKPDAFPLHVATADMDWDAVLQAAIGTLEPQLQRFLEGLSFRWCDYPAVEDLLENYPPLSPFTDALYRGTPPANGDPWMERPKSIDLFRRNLARPDPAAATVQERVAKALTHEALHWLGIREIPATHPEDE